MRGEITLTPPPHGRFKEGRGVPIDLATPENKLHSVTYNHASNFLALLALRH